MEMETDLYSVLLAIVQQLGYFKILIYFLLSLPYKLVYYTLMYNVIIVG